MGDYRMPSLGADMQVGKIAKWRVAVGDHVHRGDIVAEIETEKATIEAEVFEDGTIAALVVPEGEEVPVGTVLAQIHPAVDRKPIARRARAEKPESPVEARVEARGVKPTRRARRLLAGERPISTPGPTHSPLVRRLAKRYGLDLQAIRGTGPGGEVTRADVETMAQSTKVKPVEVRASPMARRRAAALGLDLSAVTGSGPGGAVTIVDVERAQAVQGQAKVEAVTTPEPAEEIESAPLPAPMRPTARGGTDKQAAMRHAIGALMARSKKEIPHYYLTTNSDFTNAQAWLRASNSGREPSRRILPATLMLKATALAVHDVPEMNGFFVDDQFVASREVHLGVAVSLRGGGLIAPAIHDVDGLAIDELNAKLTDLVRRTREGTLRSSEMSDPTLTVTNLGDQGVESVYGVIYPPQVALVGFGKVLERPVVVSETIAIRLVVVITLSADHRVSDGHQGARFLARIDQLLQQPEAL